MTKKDLYLYVIICVVVVALKNLYLDEVCEDGILSSYNSIINISSDTLFNMIWLTPIIFNILIISKNIYFQLINFDTRYINRSRYFRKKIIKNFFNHFFTCLFTIIAQWLTFKFIFGKHIILNFVSLQLLIKYILEIYFSVIIVVFFSMITNNYIYSFIVTIIVILLSLNLIKFFCIPFVSLFVNYKLNIINLFITFILIKIMGKKFNKVDLGGVNYETSC